MPNVEEARGAERDDGRTNVRIRDDLDAEDIGDTASKIVAEQTRDEHLSFLVEDEERRDHGG